MSKKNREDIENRIFKALGDPTRRRILYILVASATALNINDLADKFESTRQAVTKHIKVLEGAGLVRLRAEGRERLCEANPEQLRIVHEWLSIYSRFWDKSLKSLDDHLQKNA